MLFVPDFNVSREAEAAEARVGPTVDDYDAHVSSTTSWGDVNAPPAGAIVDDAQGDAREADAMPDADADAEENADGDAENADAEEEQNEIVLDQAMDDEEN